MFASFIIMISVKEYSSDAMEIIWIVGCVCNLVAAPSLWAGIFHWRRFFRLVVVFMVYAVGTLKNETFLVRFPVCTYCIYRLFVHNCFSNTKNEHQPESEIKYVKLIYTLKIDRLSTRNTNGNALHDA